MRKVEESFNFFLCFLALPDFDDEDFDLDNDEHLRGLLRVWALDLPWDPDRERRRVFLCHVTRSFIARL